MGRMACRRASIYRHGWAMPAAGHEDRQEGIRAPAGRLGMAPTAGSDMTPRLCARGRSIRGMGRRCVSCQIDFRAGRADTPPKAPRLGVRAQDDRCPEHLAWIRSLPCAVRGCPGKSQAAHVRLNTGGGVGLKPPDSACVPLCGPNGWGPGSEGHHAEQHRIGHAAFDRKYALDLRAVAETLAARSPFLQPESSP